MATQYLDRAGLDALWTRIKLLHGTVAWSSITGIPEASNSTGSGDTKGIVSYNQITSWAQAAADFTTLHVTDPATSSGTSTTFISNISQSDGLIKPVKKTLPTANASTAGIITESRVTQLGASAASTALTGLTDSQSTGAGSTTVVTGVTQSNGKVTVTKGTIPNVSSTKAGLMTSTQSGDLSNAIVTNNSQSTAIASNATKISNVSNGLSSAIVDLTNAINSVATGMFVTVTVLPTASSDTLGKIYLIKTTDSTSASPNEKGDNTYYEYITVQEGSSYKWELIGDTELEIDPIPNSYINSLALN